MAVTKAIIKVNHKKQRILRILNVLAITLVMVIASADVTFIMGFAICAMYLAITETIQEKLTSE